MSNPAFIVDGYTEMRIIQQIHPVKHLPIRRTDLNGKNVSIKAIAAKIASIIRSLGNRYYPIIILVDREKRAISFLEMCIQIRAELLLNGITDQDLRIGVPDRMIENWLIADWVNLTGDAAKEPNETDGINGASLIKNLRGSYDKINDGVEIVSSCNFEKVYAKSPSFKYFADQLKDINCPCLQFLQ